MDARRFKMKKCSKCYIEQDENEFYKDKSKIDGMRCICKQCTKETQAKYKVTHRNEKKEYCKRYYSDHKKEILLSKIKYNQENKDKKSQYNREWYQKNKDANNEHHKTYHQKRKQIDPMYCFIREIRSVINSAFDRGGWTKDSTTQELLGCSYEELLKHMGPKPAGKINKDHICPCAQAQNEEELIKLQHYTNFRWLAASDNNKKKHHKTPEAEEMCRKLLNREWID